MQPKQRILSIDTLRGAIMLIMALDHVRDFFHADAMAHDPLDLQTTTPVLFFTRWITHFCAPVFVFLSGLSAYLSGSRKTPKEHSLFLIKRGLWLVVAEITIINFGWMFNPHFNTIMLQVIWAIGWSMVLLGLLVRLPFIWIIITAIILVFGHNGLDYVTLPGEGVGPSLISALLTTRGELVTYAPGHSLLVIYAILPWMGIMLSGYALGHIFKSDFSVERRKKILLVSGLAVISLFVLLRWINSYGDPAHWSEQPHSFYTFLSFLNTSKYPPSLLFACMTIGPALLFLALSEHLNNRFTAVLQVYGRVPFFYYLLHVYAIHLLCVVLFFTSGYQAAQINNLPVPFFFRPANFGFSLPIAYLIWFLLIATLYWPCRWYDRYKATHQKWWLSYL